MINYYLFIRYWISSSFAQDINESVVIILSKSVIPNPKCSASIDFIVGGSWQWSPASTT